MLAILRRKTSSSQETLRLPENHRIPLPAGLPWYLILGIGALLLLLAVVLFDHFRHVAPALWYSPYHDRNGHYFRCQSFGMALRRGDVPGFIKAIHFATVWPPLHPLVTGLILAVGGLDYRLAVLTSLGAWVAGCWFTFALASRLVPRYRAFAGGIALVFVLASPAHRAFACDIMIESLGAALTMAVLYFYVAVCQEPTVWRGRCFALLFLALFLTKYNYWMLVAAGLFLGTLPEIGRTLRDVGPGWWSPSTWLGWLAAQLRHPLTYLILPALALAFHVQFVGPISFTLAGREQIMDNLAVPGQLCFVLLLVRIFPWWWRRGRLAVGGLPILARQTGPLVCLSSDPLVPLAPASEQLPVVRYPHGPRQKCTRFPLAGQLRLLLAVSAKRLSCEFHQPGARDSPYSPGTAGMAAVVERVPCPFPFPGRCSAADELPFSQPQPLPSFLVAGRLGRCRRWRRSDTRMDWYLVSSKLLQYDGMAGAFSRLGAADRCTGRPGGPSRPGFVWARPCGRRRARPETTQPPSFRRCGFSRSYCGPTPGLAL